jgi:hypothetical protein
VNLLLATVRHMIDGRLPDYFYFSPAPDFDEKW